jgi:uncharacterized membrane protein YgdD (TMEM256/DUF423 family)
MRDTKDIREIGIHAFCGDVTVLRLTREISDNRVIRVTGLTGILVLLGLLRLLGF